VFGGVELMRLLFLTEGVDPTDGRVRVRGTRILGTLQRAFGEVRAHYRVGVGRAPVDEGDDRVGQLFGDGDAVMSPEEFGQFSPHAVVLEGGLSAKAVGPRFWWRTDSWRLPWQLAEQYVADGGVVVALDVSLTAGGDANDYARLLGDSRIARLFGAHIAMSLTGDNDFASVQGLIDWEGPSGLIEMKATELLVAAGFEDVLKDVQSIVVGAPMRILPVGEPLLCAPLTVGILRDDLAPFTRADAWTRYSFASYHRHGLGWTAMIAGDITGEDERFRRFTTSANARFVAELVTHLTEDAHDGRDGHGHPNASHDIPESRFAGSRVLLLTVTDAERQAVREELPEGSTEWRGAKAVKWWPITRHPTPSGVEFFHAPVAKGVASALFVRLVIAAVQPRFVAMVGICAGLKEGKQRLGDVVVCSVARNLAQGKLESTSSGDTDGFAYVEDRSVNALFPADRLLLAEFDLATQTVRSCGDCSAEFRRVQFSAGEVLASPYVLKSALIRDWLKERYSEAIALEMEGAPLALTAATEFANWILVKGISDWADKRKDDAAHAVAAANAMRLIVHTFTHPWSPPGM
jgi:nucleoside phosphorylase